MEAPTVPAWKRLGLKVKETVENDPLAPGQQPAPKKTNQKKREAPSEAPQDEEESKTQKKPPKRQKLPKAERKPPPEADQLVYLRTYSQEKDAWKFSKSKQNWILRHIYNQAAIPETYKEYLVDYLLGIQGGAKDRIVEDAKAVISEWNTFMATDDKDEKETDDKDSDEKEDNAQDTEKAEKKQQKKAKKVAEKTPPTEASARIAQQIVLKLGGTRLDLILVDDAVNENAEE